MNVPSDKLRHLAIAACAAIVSAAALALGVILVPARFGAPLTEITISGGQGVSAIATQLKSAELIRSQWLFILYTLAIGQESHLQAGRYLLSPSMNIPEIVQTLARGLAESDDIEIVIPEGFNVWDIDTALSNARLAVPGRFARRFLSEEGYLFPDTYRFAKDALPDDIVRIMRADFTAKGGGVNSRAVTIASILEKEAKSPEDMALVAGIIQKRMSRGMPLQIDATVAYGWCIRRMVNFSRTACNVAQAPIASEIGIDGPYNTYIRKGLPAGPISNPGTIALSAALHPKDSPYLYYLSTRDGSKIIYAQTSQEHLANRRKYLGF